MEIEFFDEYSRLSERASALVINELSTRPGLLLCAATGNSPEGLYHLLREKEPSEPALFRGLRIIQLDEWSGLPANAEGTGQLYLRRHLLDPLGIDESRYISFASDAVDPELECRRIQSKLAEEGPIDMAVLGLGRNGHLGFNEPDQQLEPHCHVARLTPVSQQHSMMAHKKGKPEYGMTLGMKDILLSRKIILIVSGKGKEGARSSLFSEKISTACPASFLWLHPHSVCLAMRD
jgi:galactosamine-6-phosphate isomerase